jgi:Ca2+-binding EF-hand superfamily protein
MRFVSLFAGFVFVVILFAGIQNISAKNNPKKEMRCEENFKNMDTDKDGKVSLKEFMAAKHHRGNPEDIFKAKDVDKDGFLTKEEFCTKHKGQGKGRRGGK